MEKEKMKIVIQELKKAIDELGKDGLFEDEILKELYLDLHLDRPAGLYAQAEWDSQRCQKCWGFRDLVEKMIEFCDIGDEDCSTELRQAAAEFEAVAKLCVEAAERHASFPDWPHGLEPPTKHA